MKCIFNISLSTSDIIAILAFLAASLSALYARWSSLEAKKANQISLLSGRKEIYIAFFNLKMHMEQYCDSAKLVEVSKFYYSVINSQMYFPADLAKEVEEYYDACFWIAEIHSRDGGVTLQKSREDQERYLKVEKDLSSKINSKILKIFKDMNIEPKF